MGRSKKDKIFNSIKFILPLLLLFLTVIELKKIIKGINVELLRDEMSDLNYGKLALILLIALTATFPMFFYDIILIRILKLKISVKKMLQASFIANSFSNLLGFGGLVGAMLRTYFYHEYEHDRRRLLGGISSVSLFYLTGISLFSWTAAIFYRSFSLFSEEKWAYYAVLALCLYLPVFTAFHFIKNRKEAKPLITLQVGVKLLFVSMMEWLAIFFTIYLLCRLLNISVGMMDLFPIFVVAGCAGIISMIPGGLGSFDLVFLWGMQDLNATSEKVLILLFFYRTGYFVLPFLISIVLFGKAFWKKWNRSWSNLPRAIIQGISHTILTALVFISGIVLLLSASIPGIMSRVKLAHQLLSFPIMNLSHQLSVAAGFILLGLSRGIEYRVKPVYKFTMVALIFAAIISLFKGIDYEEAIFLITVALLMHFAKGQFYRESYIMTWGKTLFDVTLAVIFTLMYLIIGYANLPSARINLPRRLLPYVIRDHHDLFHSAFIGLFIAFVILLFSYLMSKPKKWKMEASADQESKIINHLRRFKGNEFTHLLFLQDKYIFWNQKGNVFLAYQQYADKLVVLGDLIGEKADFSSTIQEFQEIADLHGFTPVFYQVSNELLSYLHGNGYAFFKLGEAAFIDLETFQHSAYMMKDVSPKNAAIHLKKESFFEMVKPPYSSEFIAELKKISDDWLAGRREKGFVFGYFDETYLNRAEIAIEKNSQGDIIGFASMMPMYDDHQTASIDLMRFRSDSSSVRIESFLYSLFDWAKERGYLRFNLGLIPLANVGLSRFSFFSERIAAQIFLQNHFLYPFRGLEKFTEKNAVSWEPEFLGYRRNSSLTITMVQIALLISRKRDE